MSPQIFRFRSVLKTALSLGIGAATLTAFESAAAQQHSDYKRDLPARLMKQTHVTESTAARTALARVHNGRIESVELENENGRLIYSYELTVPGRSGVEEVNVNAKTGALVNVEHEGAAAEAKEAGRESREGSKAPKPKAAAKDTGRVAPAPGDLRSVPLA